MAAMLGFVLPAYAFGVSQVEEGVQLSSLLELPLETLLHVEVSTASKFQQPATEAPSSVTVITEADIKAYGWRTLAEILKSIRGLYVTDDRNYTYLGARGFSRNGDYNTRFLLLVDGVRTNDALYDQAAVGRDAVLDVDLIERVEYVPGSGSSIYGANAFFGVINVITKRGRDFNRPQASVDLGSHGEKKLRASYGMRTEQGTQILVSGSAYRRSSTDQYYPEFDTPATNNGIAQGLDYENNRNFYFKASEAAWTFWFAHNERERGIPTASFEQTFNDPRARTIDALSMAEFSYRAPLGESTELTSRLFWGQQAYDGFYAYPGYLNLDGARSAWTGGELSVLNQSWAGHTILAGFEYQNSYRRDQFGADEYPDGSVVATMNEKRNGHRAGLYLQDEITISRNLRANLGTRYDHHDHGSAAFSPRLALIYSLTPYTTLKAIYGKAYRAPNAFEMYYSIPGVGGQKANPDLKPEKITSSELAMEHRLSEQARMTASVYENRVKNLISQTEDLSDGMLVYRNLSGATARGMELQYELATDAGIRMRASQSWQKAEDAETGRRLPNSPISLTKLNLSLPFWQRKATAGLEAQYVGRRLTQTASVPGIWLANVNLYSEKILNKTLLSLSMFNVFNRRYGDPASVEHVQETIPQVGRTLLLKLTYTH